MPLTTLSAGNTIKASELNANFALCVLTDTARTITVSHTWSASQDFSAGLVSSSASGVRFGATAVPAAATGLATTANIVGITPDTNTNAARGTHLMAVGYGISAPPHYSGMTYGGTVTVPTTVGPTQTLAAFVGWGYDGTAFGTSSCGVTVQTAETWAVGAHGAFVKIQTIPTGGTASEAALLIKTTVSGATRLVPGVTSLVLANNADNAANVTIADTGLVTLRAGLTIAGAFAGATTVAMGGAFTGATSMTFTTTVISTTAQATLGALSATQFSAYASTASGATLQGYGTTGDVTLKNRAGTDVIVVTANSLNITVAGIGSFAKGIKVTGPSGAFAAGQIYADVTYGLLVGGVTGAANDFSLFNPAGNSVVIAVPTGTSNVTLGGALAITGALTGATTGAFSGLLSANGGVTFGAAQLLTLGATSSILAGSTNGFRVVNNANSQELFKANNDSSGCLVSIGGLGLGGATVPSNGIQFVNGAPGSLADGQIWYDGTNLKTRLGGATKTVTAV